MSQAATRESTGPYGLLLPLFIGSGCAALIYEVSWYQSLTLIVGSSAISLAVVLATYMGGMCLGALWNMRWTRAGWHPLHIYVGLELLIALFALLVLYLLPWAGGLYFAVDEGGLSGALLRGLFCAIFLLVPTMAMGATLPVIARLIDETPRGVSWLGILYATNIVGAVVGCLLAGFYLLRVHDTATATYVGATLNVVIAMAALICARKFPLATSVKRTPEVRTESASGSMPIYLAVGLSGATALGAEVIWTRQLGLMLGGTVYTFALILAAMLIGLGLGGYAGAALARQRWSAPRMFGAAQIGAVAGLAWAGWSVTQFLPLWPSPDYSGLTWLQLQADLLRCLWVILPAALCWGASVPLAMAALSPTGADNTRIAARIYVFNTFGAIAGALLTSLVLIGAVGTQDTQRILVACAALGALVLLWTHGNQLSAMPRYATGIVVLLVGSVLAWTVSPMPPVLVGYGRTASLRMDLKDDFIYVGEGMNASLAVSRRANGSLMYHNAGKVQASSEPTDARLQRMLGHLTTLTIAAPKSVLVIACGAGVTAGAVSIDPRVERETIVELEGLVPHVASTYFHEHNFNVIKNPKVTTKIEDGRHFLLTTDEKFDAITTDPFDPWVKGVANLNTLEFFQEAKRHLNPGGVITIFIQLYGMDVAATKSQMATFAQVFPNGAFFGNTIDGEGSDGVLIGFADDDMKIDVQAMQERLEAPEYAAVRKSMAEIGFNSAIDLLGTYAATNEQMKKWLADAEINRDRNLRLQYLAGFAINRRDEAVIYNQILQHSRWPAQFFTGGEDHLRALRSAILTPFQ